MFTALVGLSVRHRWLVLALAAGLSAYGALAAARLPVDVFPDLDRPTVTVMTEAEGLAPQEVEQLVTTPLETRLNGLPGVERVRSVSGVGLSITTVEFAWGTDIYRDRQQVAERLALAQDQLPRGVVPVMAPVSSIMGQILLVAVTGEGGSSGAPDPMALREAADFTIRPRLLAIPGVAQVIPIGGHVRQYRVSPDPAALRALGVGLAQVEAALAGFGGNAGGGFSDRGGREVLIRQIGRTTSLDDLRGLVVATVDGAPVRLGQVADVAFAAKPKRGDAGYRGEPAVIVSVEKQPGVDTVRLTRAVEAALADLAPSLPAGARADRVLFRQADFIEASVGNVARALAEAVAVVAVVLFAFLMNARTTAISLLAIPVSMLATAAVFHGLGLSINTMTLGGLAIAVGELVDDAVVDVENIHRRLGERRAGGPQGALAVVVAASSEVRSGIVYATLIVVLVFVPLFALSGIEGRLFAPLGQAYIVAILASLAVSLTLTPALAALLLPGRGAAPARDGRLVRALKAGEAAVLRLGLRHRGPVLGLVACAVTAAGATAWGLPRAFLPAFNEGAFTVNVTFRPGISLAESDRVGAIAERLILDLPGVRTVGRRTGRAELDEHAEGVHASDIEVALEPGAARRRDALAAEIRARLSPLPVSVNVGQPISHRLDHMLSGVRAEIALKLYGADLDVLRRTADGLHGRLAAIPGLADLQVERQARVPQVEVRVDYGRAALYGVQPAAVVDQIGRLSQGRVVSTLVDGPRRFDVVLRLAEDRRTAAGLGDTLIETPSGRVPARQVADIAETDGPNQILREGGRRRIVVQANTAPGADAGAVAAAIRAALACEPLPPGVTASLEGTFAAQEEAGRAIAGLSLLSFALVFAVLAGRYRSGALALILMGNVPLALIGSVLALRLAGLPLSVASMIGFITLTGISARNGILKVSHFLNLALDEGVPFGPDLVVRGSLERLAPVLMTAAAAGVALVPLLLDGAGPGEEILHPVAVTIFGGLVSATLLDAVLTPILFLRFGEKPLARLRALRVEAAATPGGARPAEAY